MALSNGFKFCLALTLITKTLGYQSYCGQLGCDEAGLFTQDAYKLPIHGPRELAWISKPSSIFSMNTQNENYGCVGSSKVVVCPYHSKADVESKHIMLDTDTGEEYDTSEYETLENVSMPILTKDNLVFAVNGSHASLVDPLNNRSFITALPTKNPQGVHSPIYLPDLGFFIIFGNMSLNHTIYTVHRDSKTGISALDLMAMFTIEKSSTLPCPWVPFTEPIANGNRLYLYLMHVDESIGVMAIDFMSEMPYYKKAWSFLGDQSGLLSLVTKYTKHRDPQSCTFVPKADPYDAMYPPIDVSTQLLATPDGFIMITTPNDLLVLKDAGDHGELRATTPYRAHFQTFDKGPAVNGESPNVWMAGWPQYEPFRGFLIAFNYTNALLDLKGSFWAITLDQHLGVAELNVTSRLTTFTDPINEDRKILVFGISVNYNDPTSPFHTKYCPECKLGINNLLMAVLTSQENTIIPDILWITPVPIFPSMMEVRGQVIGVSDKLVMYVTDGQRANIVALK